MVLGVTLFGSFITTATIDYPPTGAKKIGMWSDSTTALGRWTNITLPTDVTDYLSAKSRRFFSWADKVAYTRYWPLVTKHLPGDQNDISHIMSHLGEQTRERQQYFNTIGATTICCPATLHSFHADEPVLNPADKYHQVHLQLNATEALEMQRAYRKCHYWGPHQ